MSESGEALRVRARAAFAVCDARYAQGTSKRYAWADFEPVEPPMVFRHDEFLQRLEWLFGAAGAQGHVLWHRATGFIVTAYAAQSGPAFGGGPRWVGALPPEVPAFDGAALFAESQARAARVKADPLLAQLPPMQRLSVNALNALTAADLLALQEAQRDWQRHFNDVAAPPGFAEVVRELHALVAAVPLP